MPRPTPQHRRPHDWPDRIPPFLEERRTRPFAWGQHDCILMMADFVAHLVGVDALGALRGTWSDEATADAMLFEAGGMQAAIEGAMLQAGIPSCPPAFAQRGDVALVAVGNQLLGGVVCGAQVAVTGVDGLRFVPRRAILAAWAV